MKKTIFLISIALLLSCFPNSERFIHVSYPDTDGIDILSLELFSDIEIIRFTGENCPMLTSDVYLIVQDNIYYMADPYTEKVYRFDQNGLYMNSIGSKGRGPNEYLSISSMTIDNQGNISIFSEMGEGVLVTYNQDGKFLERTTYPYSSSDFASLNGLNYHYFGDGSGMDYQLYVTNNKGETIEQFFPSSQVLPLSYFGSVFSQYNQTLNICPVYGNDIYQLNNGKWEVKYSFDFGAYRIPDEYFKFDNMGDAFDLLITKTAAFKTRFLENKRCAFLQASIDQMDTGTSRILYGVLDKNNTTWKWLYIKEDDYCPTLKYLDESFAYFAVEPEEIKEAGMMARLPLLQHLTEDDGMVILKCRL